MILLITLFSSFASSIPITYIPSTRIPPSQRLYLVMDYYAPSDMLIVFSGIDNLGSNNDLWSYSLTSNYWEQIIPTDQTTPGNS